MGDSDIKGLSDGEIGIVVVEKAIGIGIERRC